jgi:hypothetical protein
MNEQPGPLNSIPKIYRLGERHNIGIFTGPVVVQEKYDGSQFSFRATKDLPFTAKDAPGCNL